MPLFSDPRKQRRAVLLTLAAWVFALMAGIANACLLQDGSSVRAGPQERHGSSTHPDAAVAAQPAALAAHPEPAGDADPDQAACEKFCVADASAAVKQENCQGIDPGPAAWHACGWMAESLRIVVAMQAVDDRPFPHDTPISIRFGRLRL